MVTVLFLGDVVGKAGRKVVAAELARLKAEHRADLTIVNGENSAGGLGIDPETADEIFKAGADVITTGNHVWGKKSIFGYLEQRADRLIRPSNYAVGAPGRGWTTYKTSSGVTIGVANLVGRVFMNDLVDCPFREIDRLLAGDLAGADLVLLDFHAEATSEKIAMGHYVDGRVTMVVGTHTHVQTADERLLPRGTAYLTDAGMCGPRDSVIGVKIEPIVERFLTGRPTKFDVAKGDAQLNGVVFRCDPSTKKAVSVERINSVHA